MRRLLKSVILLVVFITLSLPLTDIVLASDSEIMMNAQYRQAVEVTLDISSSHEISSLDPAIASDSVSITPIQNLFLNLTDIDRVTNEVVPELATTWTVSEDGLIWTFTLREDVNWMQYDPSMGQATTIRPVVAEDFVYGIKRACDSRLRGYYGTVLARVLSGCDVINQTPVEEATDELVFGDTIQVYALDDTTLELHLQFSAGYFLSMTTMFMTAAVPKEAINEFGDDWTAAGNIITNGPYFIEENVRGLRRAFVRNTALPSDLEGTGNIDRITYTVIEDGGTEFALYQDNQLDTSRVPAAELEFVLESQEYTDQLRHISDPTVFYFAYNHSKLPFDNVHVRRAFSAILDREAFVEEILGNKDIPMIHFTPLGVMHAPPLNEVGVGFNPDYAREQLDLAGYPNCEGFPNIDIVTYTGAGTWAEFWAANAEEHLGCDASLFNIEQLEFTIIPPDPNAIPDFPHAETRGWGPDYPDANNWVNDVLHCTVENELFRPCSDVDNLIEAIGAETDQQVRTEGYRQIEEGFFGEEGEFPILPIFMRANYILVKPWYTGPFTTDGIYGGTHWNTYSIDMTTKLAARDE